mmetsp:Transcript_23195/g.48007  ORF Transcript_23195/g.48007 Transcript_23195/m.48007 type:complete len:658 (-) Transcript_23195:75-2048(-)
MSEDTIITLPNNLIPNKTRLRDPSGFTGTLLYLGPVASAKSSTEIYAGIAWDDVTRGKHDGSVICRRTNQIVRHFKCGPTQGSFLRLNKVDTGVELTPELMRGRYVEPDAELVAPGNLLPHVAKTSGGRDKPIEFWGELEIRNRQQLEVVEDISLRMLGIARPCGDKEKAGMEEFRHLKGIDLAANLLCDWEDVLEILRQFPLLENVSLASNRINDLVSAREGEFSLIRSLNLNNCNIGSFRTIQLLGKSMPKLEELCVAHCDLSDIGACNSECSTDDEDDKPSALAEVFQNLVLLDASDCQLTSWEKQILQLHQLPKLESLILNDNKINVIELLEYNSGEAEPGALQSFEGAIFPALTSLQLAGTSISSWASIDSLDNLPSLRSLRLRNTPLTNTLGVGEVRSTVIARLSRIEYFNASPITDRERLEAERRYVSNVARELLMTSSEMTLCDTLNQSYNNNTGNCKDNNQAHSEIDDTQTQIFTLHPRFKALLDKHKDIMVSLTAGSHSKGDVVCNQGGIGDDVINITIRSMAASSCDMEPLRKRLPRSLKVGRIQAMCARAFGVDIDLQILHFRVKGDPFPTELDDADHTLAYYGVSDGAEILVNEVDVDARERENARRVEEHNRLVEEQEQHVSVLQSMQKSIVNVLANDTAQKL